MYTVSKGPSKIVAKTRRGINQNLERLDTTRDLNKKNDTTEDNNNDDISRLTPKFIFNTNGKNKFVSQKHRNQEVITPQHEELIKYVHESWNEVEDNARTSEETNTPSETVYYNDGEPNVVLQDFKPFDLESWWGKRLFNNITKSL